MDKLQIDGQVAGATGAAAWLGPKDSEPADNLRSETAHQATVGQVRGHADCVDILLNSADLGRSQRRLDCTHRLCDLMASAGVRDKVNTGPTVAMASVFRSGEGHSLLRDTLPHVTAELQLLPACKTPTTAP